MHDPLSFESRLADAFDRYLAGAPVEVNPRSLVAALAAASAPRRPLFPLPTLAGRPRWGTVLVVALLLVALAVSGALLVGRLLEQRPGPHVYTDVLVAGPALGAPRGQPAVVRLRDDRVLIVGGNVGLTTTAEVWDLAAGTSAPTGPLAEAEALVISSLAMLPDGRVLLVGDARPSDRPFYAVAEIFDPSTLAFTAVGPEVTPRADANLISLPDGRVLMTGGTDPIDINTTLDRAELFDPATNTFVATGSMLDSREFHSTVALPDGRVLLVGGEQSLGGGATMLDAAELYDPTSGAFSAAGQLPVAGRVVAVPLRDGRAIVFHGDDFPDGPVTAAVWASGSFTNAPAPDQPPGQGVLLDDGRLLLTGTWSAGQWVGVYDLGSGATTVANALGGWFPTLVRLADGRVLLIGGLEDGDVHNPELGGHLAPPVSTVQVFE